MSLIPWRNKRRQGNGHELATVRPAGQLRSELDRVFERFFGEPWWGGFDEPFGPLAGWSPSLDVSEGDREITIRAELPGVDAKDVNVTVSGNLLTVSGEKKETSEERGESRYRAERRFGSFQRTIELPDSVDAGKVSAEHANGVLTIHLEKRPGAAPKKIPVNVSKG